MKIQAIKTDTTGFYIKVAGEFHRVTYREILARQGIVIVPPELKAGTKVASQDPEDEDAPLQEIQDAVDNLELAGMVTKWAKGGIQDGTRPTDLEVA
jgi:hypothetical protein